MEMIDISYYFIAFNKQCMDIDTVSITVYPLYGINPSFTDTAIIKGSSIPLVVNDEFETYEWTPGEYLDDSTVYNPIARPPDSVTFIIKAYTYDHCLETASFKIRVEEKYAPPTGFTPNGDGINDYWDLPSVELIQEVSIFNSWGERVFYSDHYNRKFDGHALNGKELPVGTYYYVIVFNDLNTELSVQRGTITIVRSRKK